MKQFVVYSFVVIALAGTCRAIEPDEEGCKDSKLVTRVPKCRITECSSKEFDSAEVITGFRDGEVVKKTLEGATEILNYECDETISVLQAVRNVEGALRRAGYKVVYSGKGEVAEYPLVTAQDGAQWVEVAAWQNGGTPNYRQTAVKVQKMEQAVEATAAQWSQQIEADGHVAIYGITFDTGKAVLKPESEPVLRQLLTMLTEHDDWKLRIEGHTDNVGAKAANQALSQQRAAAVVAWLIGQGIDKGRVSAAGAGDSKPVADNSTEEGRAKNRRVEAVKL